MKTILSAVMAGILISIGGVAFLKVGSLFGAVLFTLGLLGVVHYRLSLYTGSVGFIHLRSDKLLESKIILGNILGCAITALLVSLAYTELNEPISKLMEQRLSLSWYAIIIRAIGCGIIMSLAVQFGREGRFLPLLFGVPCFIMCGFLHSIADSFYYSLSLFTQMVEPTWKMLLYIILTYFGNMLGCRMYRMLILT